MLSVVMKRLLQTHHEAFARTLSASMDCTIAHASDRLARIPQKTFLIWTISRCRLDRRGAADRLQSCRGPGAIPPHPVLIAADGLLDETRANLCCKHEGAGVSLLANAWEKMEIGDL